MSLVASGRLQNTIKYCIRDIHFDLVYSQTEYDKKQLLPVSIYRSSKTVENAALDGFGLNLFRGSEDHAIVGYALIWDVSHIHVPDKT